jgi:hypothetical protein
MPIYIPVRVYTQCQRFTTTGKRKPSPDFSDEGLVDFRFGSYFLQHLPWQHFGLLLQQSAAGEVAVAVPINAVKVAIKRRYFIRSSFQFN